MIIIKVNPITPGTRHRIKNINLNLDKKPFRKLLTKYKKNAGRNNQGHITVRHRGGGHKKKYRLIDFKRNKYNIWAKVKKIEYDPNRSSYIALLLYKDGERRYIICPKGINKGDNLISGNNNEIPIQLGNCLPLYLIPLGSLIHNIELKIGKGAQLIRSAGSSAQIIAKENKYIIIRLKSGEIRKINNQCKATLGEVSNSDHSLQMYGKAGRKRWLGIRPTVRGTAMNPIDHPHGGGEGKNFGKHPRTPWGKSTKGFKTRKNKISEKFIINHCNK